MTNTKQTKRALLTSAMALFLCFAMLLGTTYAWFTDSVTSANNIIQSGNLNIELYWSTDARDWKKVNENTNVFSKTLWEPGHTEVVYLKVVNEGSLALKYQLGVNVISEKTGKNAAGELFKLSNYIKFDVIENVQTAYADRIAALAAVEDGKVISAGYSKFAALEKTNDTDYLAMVVYMPETVGNEANHDGVTKPSINLGINLVATQYSYESDNFGNDYDLDSLPCDVIATPENIQDVLAAAKPGDVIGLADGAYYDMSIVIPCDDITLVSNTAIADHVNVNGKKNVKIIGITFDAYAPQPVKDPKNGTTTILANITSAEGSKGAENLQIINCKFTNLYGANADNYCPIAVYDRQRVSGASNNITIDGCTFDTNAAYYVYMYYPGDASIKPTCDIVIKNNVFGNVNTTVDTGSAVYVGGTKNNVTVVNNTFTNCGVTVTPHNNASCTYALKVSVADNNFINTGDVDLNAIALRNFHSLPKCNTYVAGNVANYGLSEIKAPYVDSSAYECYDIEADSAIVAVPLADAYDVDGNQTAAFKAALKAKDATVILGSGDYGKVPTIGEGATIIGTEGTMFASNDTALSWNTLNNATFKNITFSGSNAQRWNYAKGAVVFENCTFEAHGVYAIHYDGTAGADIVYKNCTITGWVAITGGHNSLTFDGCTINGNGTYGVIRVYGDATIKNCIFDVSAVNTTDVYQDGIHAVDCLVEVENVINVNGDVVDLFNISGTGAIKMDGKAYVANAGQLKNAVANGETNIALAQDMTIVADDLKGASSDLTVTLAANTTVTIASGAAQAKNLTFTGDKSSKVALVNTNPGYEGKLAYHDNANLTFEGITFDANQITGICARGGVVTFVDCFITGELEQTIASKFVFSGCTFDVGVTQVGYGCSDVVFEDCDFETDGYGIKIYAENKNASINLTVMGCSFKNAGSDARSAILLDHIIDGISYNITVENCTFEGYTATPTATYNKWAERMIVADSVVQTADGQYIFSYQTGVEGGNYLKILTDDQLVVTLK